MHGLHRRCPYIGEPAPQRSRTTGNHWVPADDRLVGAPRYSSSMCDRELARLRQRTLPGETTLRPQAGGEDHKACIRTTPRMVPIRAEERMLPSTIPPHGTFAGARSNSARTGIARRYRRRGALANARASLDLFAARQLPGSWRPFQRLRMAVQKRQAVDDMATTAGGLPGAAEHRVQSCELLVQLDAARVSRQNRHGSRPAVRPSTLGNLLSRVICGPTGHPTGQAHTPQAQRLVQRMGQPVAAACVRDLSPIGLGGHGAQHHDRGEPDLT